MGEAIKWCVSGIGVLLFIFNLFILARRRITPVLGVSWSVFSVLLVVLGFTLHLTNLDIYMSSPVAAILVLALLGLIATFYHMSVLISELVDKTNELSMQVSLLNSENVRLLREIRQLEMEETDSGDHP